MEEILFFGNALLRLMKIFVDVVSSQRQAIILSL